MWELVEVARGMYKMLSRVVGPLRWYLGVGGCKGVHARVGEVHEGLVGRICGMLLLLFFFFNIFCMIDYMTNRGLYVIYVLSFNLL